MTLQSWLMIGGGAIAAIVLATQLLPSTLRIEKSAIIKADAASIYPLLSSNAGFQTFNPYKDTDPDLKIALSGPATGVGSSFSFEGKEGKGTQTITSLTSNKSVTMLIDLGFQGQPVQTLQLHPTGDGTRVSWVLDMDFGRNPIGRVMGLFLDGMMGPTLERGLGNLSTAVANQAT
ncbi:MAG: SRPBCC family protein [Cohaesibacteraceae bacterium]|nr:SRPBCC family protein [Cohaesibacteraceae bacterium]MBL4875655.1 SRPBCC family protein [Cohaesibacteraceae bacterium]